MKLLTVDFGDTTAMFLKEQFKSVTSSREEGFYYTVRITTHTGTKYTFPHVNCFDLDRGMYKLTEQLENSPEIIK